MLESVLDSMSFDPILNQPELARFVDQVATPTHSFLAESAFLLVCVGLCNSVRVCVREERACALA